MIRCPKLSDLRASWPPSLNNAATRVGGRSVWLEIEILLSSFTSDPSHFFTMTGDKYHSSRQRSRSPDHSRRDRRHHHHHHHHHKTRTRTPPPPPVELPLNARALVKYDLKQFRSLLGLYLDIQKQIDIDELSDTEVKGRWKSFLGKW
jgi:hypothetical protein